MKVRGCLAKGGKSRRILDEKTASFHECARLDQTFLKSILSPRLFKRGEDRPQNRSNGVEEKKKKTGQIRERLAERG